MADANATSAPTPDLAATYEAVIKADKPISFWPLDDPSGSTTAHDLTGPNTGSVQGGVIPGGATGPMAERDVL